MAGKSSSQYHSLRSSVIAAIRQEQNSHSRSIPLGGPSITLPAQPLVPQSAIDNLAHAYRRFFDLKTNLQGLHDTLQSGIDRYIRFIYPINPIVSCSSLRQRFLDQRHLFDLDFASLVLAVSAVSLLAPGSTTADEEAARYLLKYALCIQSSSPRMIDPSMDSLAALIAVGGLLRTEYGDNASYIKMKESISLAEIMQLDRAETYAGLAEEERQAVLSMFWILAVGEK